MSLDSGTSWVRVAGGPGPRGLPSEARQIGTLLLRSPGVTFQVDLTTDLPTRLDFPVKRLRVLV